MELYTFLRELADSWGLVALVAVFIGVVIFAFRPGSRELHDYIARTPLRNDTLPEDEDDDAPRADAKLAEER